MSPHDDPLSAQDQAMVEVLARVDPGDAAAYGPESLMRQARRRGRSVRAAGILGSCAAVTAVVLAVGQLGSSGSADSRVIPVEQADAEPFGDRRMAVCFFRADLDARVSVAVAEPAPGNTDAADPNVTSSRAAVADCARLWRDPLTRDLMLSGSPSPGPAADALGATDEPDLFACDYDLEPDEAIGYRGRPPSTKDVAVFPAFPGEPSTCVELGLDRLDG